MLAAIHIRQTNAPTECVTYAALTWENEGATETALFSRPGSTSEARYAAGLDAFAYLVDATAHSNSGACVHITDAGLRREIAHVAASFPSIHMLDTVRGRLVSIVERASSAISDHVAILRSDFEERRIAKLAARPTLLVATDASKSSRRRGVGAACVSIEGKRRQKMYPQARSVLAGELLAIELAITGFPDRSLSILTDSRSSIACLQMDRSAIFSAYDGEVLTIVEGIRDLRHGREVNISWVKGHSGHFLNEIADRLAVSTRRSHEAGVPEHTRRAIADNIVASLALEQVAA